MYDYRINVNPWGEDGSGGLEIFNKLQRQGMLDDRTKMIQDRELARQNMLDERQRLIDQELSAGRAQDRSLKDIAIQDATRQQGIRGQVASGLAALDTEQVPVTSDALRSAVGIPEGENSTRPLTAEERRLRVAEITQKADPLKEIFKNAEDVTAVMDEQKLMKSTKLMTRAFQLKQSGKTKDEVKQIMSQEIVAAGEDPNTLLANLDNTFSTPTGLVTHVPDAGMAVVLDISGGKPKTSVLKLSGKSEEELALAQERNDIARARLGQNKDNLENQKQRIAQGWQRLDPNEMAKRGQAEMVGKEQGKYTVELAKKVDEGAITMQKIGEIRSKINDPQYQAGVLGSLRAKVGSWFPSFKALFGSNQREALQVYAPVLMTDLKSLLGPQISNSDAQMMLTMTGGDFNDPVKVDSALNIIETRIQQELVNAQSNIANVQAPGARQMVTNKNTAPKKTAAPSLSSAQKQKIAGSVKEGQKFTFTLGGQQYSGTKRNGQLSFE